LGGFLHPKTVWTNPFAWTHLTFVTEALWEKQGRRRCWRNLQGRAKESGVCVIQGLRLRQTRGSCFFCVFLRILGLIHGIRGGPVPRTIGWSSYWPDPRRVFSYNRSGLFLIWDIEVLVYWCNQSSRGENEYSVYIHLRSAAGMRNCIFMNALSSIKIVAFCAT